MLTIAGGIIIAFIVIVFFGAIVSIVASLGFLILIGALIVGGIFLISTYPDLFLPFIVIAVLIYAINLIVKSLSKVPNDYADAYVLTYFKYRFLRFTSQSKINYYKNLEIAKNKIENKKKEKAEKLAKKVRLEKQIEEQKKHDRQVKRFSKLINDLKKLEKKINTEKNFSFRYDDLYAMITVNKDFDDRSLKFEYGYEKKTFMSEPSFTLEGHGDSFSINEIGTRKEIIDRTIKEIGKILARSES